MFLVAAVEDDGVDVASDLYEVAAARKSHGLDPQETAISLSDAGRYLLANLNK